MLPRETDCGDTVKIIDPRLFPLRTPACCHRFRDIAEIRNRCVAPAPGKQSTSAQERQLTVIEDVAGEIRYHNPSTATAHETIQRLFEEDSSSPPAGLVGQI